MHSSRVLNLLTPNPVLSSHESRKAEGIESIGRRRPVSPSCRPDHNALFNRPEWLGYLCAVRWVVEGAAVYERLLRFSLLPDDTSYKFPDSI